MRCFVRNAGAMLAMFWSAAVARAGPVHIRPTFDFSPAAIKQPQAEPTGETMRPLRLPIAASEPRIAWLPENLALQPATPMVAAPDRPLAIMIPLPAPICLALAGLGSIFIFARPFYPWRMTANDEFTISAT